MKLVIINYGSGNLHSVHKAFEAVNNNLENPYEIIVTNTPSEILNADKLVLPGVGAFQDCKNAIHKIDGLFESLEQVVIGEKKDFMGICVGMQLLADNSEENGNHQGLGWIEGTIKKLPGADIKLPHMGWNKIKIVNKKSEIKPAENDYYFVHSYYFDCTNSDEVLAETKYAINFPSIVNKENVYGCQFHPEKSSDQGLNIIRDFINL